MEGERPVEQSLDKVRQKVWSKDSMLRGIANINTLINRTARLTQVMRKDGVK